MLFVVEFEIRSLPGKVVGILVRHGILWLHGIRLIRCPRITDGHCAACHVTDDTLPSRAPAASTIEVAIDDVETLRILHINMMNNESNRYALVKLELPVLVKYSNETVHNQAVTKPINRIITEVDPK